MAGFLFALSDSRVKHQMTRVIHNWPPAPVAIGVNPAMLQNFTARNEMKT
jgi:hypothetical protein